MLSLAGTLLGTDSVRLYQDTAFFKELGDRESAWHQDQTATPFDKAAEVITMWIPLMDVDETQGTLRFASKSHGRHAPLSLRDVPADKRIDSLRYIQEQDLTPHYEVTSAPRMAVGDVSVHLGWTFHSAGPNMGATTRRALALTFFKDGAKIADDFLFKTVPSDYSHRSASDR